MNPKIFIERLCSLDFENTFNPYSDHCEAYDREDAPKLRREALLSILEVAVKRDIDAIWIGRDLGHRGGRRTGLALTDEAHIQEHATRWGISIDRPIEGDVVTERTAAIIWKVLSQIDSHVFLWNVFPLHPHEPSSPFSNRSHKASERYAGENLLVELIQMIKPSRVIAIGNDAASSASRVVPQLEVIKVRHPSYGGQNQFIDSMYDLYCLH